MSSTSTGRQAEDVVAVYLRSAGFVVHEQNWRTRYCEIDIVAERRDCMYFVEVKYRSSDLQGSGLEYVTPKKQQQMSFAAEVWVANHNWQGDYCLAAIEVSGAEFTVGELIEL